MELLKKLVTVVAVCFGIAFLDGILVLGLPQGFYTLLGLIELVCLVWLLKIVYTK